MDNGQLTSGADGYVKVRVQDLYKFAGIAHRLRQEIGDPRLPGYARHNYSVVIQSVDEIIEHAGGDTNADA